MWVAKVEVMPKTGVLDPQGKAVQGGLATLGFKGVADVRIGKLVEMQVEAGSRQEAESLVGEACRKLLVNPVTEQYRFTLEEASA